MYVQNRPVTTTTAPRIYAQPQGSGVAPQPVSVAVNNVQPQSAGSSIFGAISGLLSGVFGFVKGLLGKLFSHSAPTNTPVTPAPTQPGTSGQVDDATLAAQFGLQNTPQNVATFRQALASEQAEPGVIGPGSANTEAVTELQQLLQSWGFQVTANGQFDQATAQAVMDFKVKNGLTEQFVFSNGQPGVTPFIDNRTRNAMIALLGNAQAPGTTATPAPAPAPAPTTQPTVDTAALAQQFHLAPDAANMTAYQAVAAEQIGKGAIGPGNAPAEAVTEMQQLLQSWGYSVQPNGQFDQATIDALLTFKAQNGLTDSRFKMSDGTAGVTAFVDDATKNLMLQKLNQTQPAPAPAPAPAPTTTSTTPTPAPAPAPAPTPAPAPAPAPTSNTSGLTADQLAVCQQQGIQASAANYQAFMTEAQALESQNALGPGSTDTQAITELQQVLAGWGYTVQQNGQFDQATIDAVLKFKRDNNLFASYLMADGSKAVHPFIDDATKQVMIKKLGG